MQCCINTAIRRDRNVTACMLIGVQLDSDRSRANSNLCTRLFLYIDSCIKMCIPLALYLLLFHPLIRRVATSTGSAATNVISSIVRRNYLTYMPSRRRLTLFRVIKSSAGSALTHPFPIHVYQTLSCSLSRHFA